MSTVNAKSCEKLFIFDYTISIIVLLSIVVSIFVFINDCNVFSLMNILVFLFVNE